MLSDILSILGHDLSNDLAAATLVTGFLRRSVATGEAIDTESVEDLAGVLRTMRQQIELSLVLRRLLLGISRPRPAPHDPVALVSRVARETGIRLTGGNELPQDRDGARITADRELVRYAVEALARRALAVSRQETDADLSVRHGPDGGVAFVIRDSGRSDDLTRINAILQREEARVVAGPFAIELVFSRIVTDLHGGRIRAVLSPDERTTITVELRASHAGEDAHSD